MKVFTTGQVARICGVATRTVTKWFDSGKLNGFRIPGSRDRRIPEKELRKFLIAYEMPIELLDKTMEETNVRESESTPSTSQLYSTHGASTP